MVRTPITDFHGPHYWLDNMWLVPIQWDDQITFNAVEQGFVYFKTTNPVLREEILQIEDPYAAKAFGRSMNMRTDWDEIKFGIMYELVRKKFDQHMDLRVKLLNTGDAVLIEGNTWDDNIWGDCICENCSHIRGQNFLGKTLMSIRAQYVETLA